MKSEEFKLVEKAQALDIIKVAEKLELPIKKKGRILWTLCLWHNDSSPSLQLGGRKGYESQCHCYSCDCSHGVISLVMASRNCTYWDAINWLDREFGLSRNIIKTDEKKPPPSLCPPSLRSPIAHSRLPQRRRRLAYGTLDEVKGYISLQNALSRCLQFLYPMTDVARVTNGYYLGTDYDVCHYDHTLFPSIDQHQRVHHIKAQGFVTDPKSPRFGHRTKGETYWVGQRLLKGKDVDTDCLFGEHLLPRNPDKVVMLVESPKNAVVGACQYPDLLWLATGNKGMLKRPLLEPLRGRRVIVMPDRDSAEEWRAKIQGMQDIATFQMSTFCDCQAEADDKKLDIADLILNRCFLS